MKIRNLLSFTVLILFLSVLALVLISGNKPEEDFEPLECEKHVNDATIELQINFKQYQGYYSIPSRASAYTDWFPYEDLRNGHAYPELSLSNSNDSYYCVVRVTNPSCPGWGTKTTIMKTSNGAGDGHIDITVPDPGLLEEILIKVDYYERSLEFPYISAPYGDRTMLRYHYEEYLMGYDPNLPVILELVYAETIDTSIMSGPPPPIHPILLEIEEL